MTLVSKIARLGSSVPDPVNRVLRAWGVDPAAHFVDRARLYAAGLVVAGASLASGVAVSCGGGGTIRNIDPVAEITSSPSVVLAGGSVSVAGEASDADGSIDRVVFSVNDNSVVDRDAPYEATLDAPSFAGEYSVEMTAYDDRGASGSDDRPLEVIVCDVNPAVDAADEAGIPSGWVSVLGEDCVLDENESYLTDLLSRVRARSNDSQTISDVIAYSIADRFVNDDGEFWSEEKVALERIFDGRTNRYGERVTRGWLAMFDENLIEIPNADFFPLASMPLIINPFPSAYNGDKAEPVKSDEPYLGSYALFNRGTPEDRVSFLELAGSNVSPSPEFCNVERLPGPVELSFLDATALSDTEVVNPWVGPVDIDEAYHIENNGIRNASVILKPRRIPASFGYVDATIFLSHLDDQTLVVSEGDVAGLEDRLAATVEPDLSSGRRLIYTITTKSSEDADYVARDPFDPMSGLSLIEATYFSDVDNETGRPTKFLASIHNGQCWIDGGPGSEADPMVYTIPLED